MIIGGSADEPVGPLQDVVRAPLNWQLVDSTVVQLQKASDDLVQLYKRISLDYEMEDSERAQMLQKLAFTAGISQQVCNISFWKQTADKCKHTAENNFFADSKTC